MPPNFISHTYAASIQNYTVTVTESGGNNCVITDSGGSHEISLIFELANKRQKRKRGRSRFLIPFAKF